MASPVPQQRRVVLSTPKRPQLTARPISATQTLNDRFTKLIRTSPNTPAQNLKLNNIRRAAQAQRTLNRSSIVLAKRTNAAVIPPRKFVPAPRSGVRAGSIGLRSTRGQGTRRAGTTKSIVRPGSTTRRGARRKNVKDTKPSKETLDQEMEEYRKKDPNYPSYLKEQLDSELDAYMDTREQSKASPCSNIDAIKTEEKKE